MRAPFSLWARLDSGWRLALATLVAARLVLGIVGVLTQQLAADRPVTGGYTYLVIEGGEPWSLFLSTWQRWDALWYQKVAEEGYQAGPTTNFYPLYPLLARMLSVPLGGHVVWAELILSSVCFVIALRLLYALTLRDSPRRTRNLELATRSSELEAHREARLAVLLQAFFPTAFFLLAPFTESLFLTLALAAFWLARRERWWASGLVAFFAALTRLNGVGLALPLAFEYLRQRGTFTGIRTRLRFAARDSRLETRDSGLGT